MKLQKTLLALCLSSSLSVNADDSADIERITVSSGFRMTDLQALPASASVIPQAVIQDRQAQHLDEILNAAANVNFASGASRGRFVQIRGIGERSQFSEGINPSIAVLIDDIDFSGAAAVGTLFDVAQVDILKGPQPTEGGANALGGIVRLTTTEATAQQTSIVEVSMAQQNTWTVGAATGGALSDNWNYRVAVHQHKSDGFIENTFLERDDTDNLDEFTGRLKLRYQPSGATKLDLNYQYFNINNGYDAFSLDNTRQTRSDEPGFDKQRAHAFGVNLSHIHSWGEVIAIANHHTSDLAYGFDEDWTFTGFHPFGYTSTDAYFRDRDTSTLDLRAVSNPYSALFNGKTDWVVGVYAQRTQTDLLREYTFNEGDFTSDYQRTNYAAYVQTDTRLSSTLTLRVGMRVDQFEIEYNDITGFDESTDNTMVGGKIALDQQLEHATVYVSVARGYKAAGVNPDQNVSQANRAFDPEYVWNYETGVKGSFLDDDAFVRLALFYMDRVDTQVSDFDVLQREDGSAEFFDIIGNADTGTNWGIELESSWQVTDDFLLQANYGFLDAHFSGYTQANGNFVARQEQAQAPRYTFNVVAQWFLGDDFRLRLEADGKDEFRFSDGHDERSPSYVLVNANLDYTMDAWQFTLWTRNLFDREYFVRGFGGFSNDPRDEFAFPEPYFQLGDGRQAGITARYQF